jgi:phospho-acceptor domain-containing protein
MTAVCVPVRCEGELVGALEIFSTQARRREHDVLAILDAIGAQLGQFVERKCAEAESERVKSEFFALVSHELRTPLTAITGYPELLRDEVELDKEARGFVDVIDRNAERLLGLVGDVLFVTQLEAGRFELQAGRVSRRPAPDAGATRARAAMGASPTPGETTRHSRTTGPSRTPSAAGENPPAQNPGGAFDVAARSASAARRSDGSEAAPPATGEVSASATGACRWSAGPSAAVTAAISAGAPNGFVR